MSHASKVDLRKSASCSAAYMLLVITIVIKRKVSVRFEIGHYYVYNLQYDNNICTRSQRSTRSIRASDIVTKE